MFLILAEKLLTFTSNYWANTLYMNLL